jgi:hyperosmotically inducible periplasmic protein
MAVLACVVSISAFGLQEPPSKPDNTKVNKRDRTKGEVIADQQSNAKTDRELSRKIRRALVQDKSLSTYAHNVQVITRNGTVTLKGQVRSEDEKKAVESKAVKVAGGATITNELQVARVDRNSEPKEKTTRILRQATAMPP